MSAGRSRSCSSAAADSSPPASSPTTCGPSPAAAAGRATCSTGTGGATTRWSVPPTASTAPGRVRGRSTSRTASSPGRPRRPTTRRWARIGPSTSPAVARAAPRFPGTPTRRPGCGIPYARGVLVEMYREARARLGDPVLAWADIQADPQRRRRYHQARGKGGLVRVSWAEATEMIAAAHVHTIKTYGPDRVAGFSPIPAMSMVSHAAGSRFVELIGGVMTSFYDWYADLPVASPQVFGDQTDVPESGDWWDASYLMMWGSNVPVTRTPDAHWMAEVRYRGTKVVSVSPDYADNTKFADEWMPCAAGHRRGAGDGDGSRHPVGMLRAPTGFRSSSTTCASTPICRSWSSWRNATACWCPARTSPPPISARTSRTRRSNRCCSTGPPTPSPCRRARWDSVTATTAWASGTWISATWYRR